MGARTTKQSYAGSKSGKIMSQTGKPQDSLIPTFFYCSQETTNRLHRVDLLTGERTCHNVPSYLFELGYRWTELPGGSLLITGGNPRGRDVRKIDTPREYAVSSLPPMRTARSCHAAAYHSQYLYVLGGRTQTQTLNKCEMFVCAESRWEVLPSLPVAGSRMSAVELENSLYALGGWNERKLDTVQKLSLDSLTWQLMQLKLPQGARAFPCFKSDTQVYLVINETLYCFTPLQIEPIKTLSEDIVCYSSYYSRGTLYYELGDIKSSPVGELTSL
jgi:hypothetical protein